ncbi:phage tail sheath family protein [Anaerolineae bacterium CFX9]|nr:phage tail sheath family protein [Anaerolineae bacterium CFX9]
MPITPTYPGVYVQEVPSGVRSIAGVSTSIGLFIGRARKGPLNEAVRLFSYTDFERTFSSDSSVSSMPDHVRLFFLNGGTDCYVMRIAHGATFAQTALEAEDGATNVLVLTAKYPGTFGETIRATVSYGGANPESTFNLDLFREEVDAAGRVTISDNESFKNLSMDPNSPNYAPDVVTSGSKLVKAALPSPAPTPSANGFSMSGAPVLYDSAALAATFLPQWAARLGSTATTNRFNISVDGERFVPVNLATINVGAITAPNIISKLEDAIAGAINTALAAGGLPGKSVTVSLTAAGEMPAAGAGATLDDGVTAANATSILKITSANAANTGSVQIAPATTDDLAAPLMLGTAQGGLEVSAYSRLRPAPTGISLRASDPVVMRQIAEIQHGQLTVINLDGLDSGGAPTTVPIALDLLADTTNAATDPLWRNDAGLNAVLARIADAINSHRNANPLNFFWTAALVGNRLTLTNSRGTANSLGTLSTGGTNIAARFNINARYYSLGAGAQAGFQNATPAVNPDGTNAASVTDGSAPQLADYVNVLPMADRQIDLFNLMVLPEDADDGAVSLAQVYGPASVFCQQRRAFLIMDAPRDWESAQDAFSKVASTRIGLVKDHSALYFPRLVVPAGRKSKTVGAAGAVAGVYARIDGTRGVWKAPAGVEADIRGITGLAQRFSDPEHGAMNPRGINVMRSFPNGLVIYGARTNDGDDDFASEYKYIPIRRLALYIEESLYRGLKWVVFEPNDEPLWAQIRLNVGVFMHDLFRRGAFQGSKPSDAYFVKCDRETTTQSDRNLGIVNILVGFAPLKPAEFVLLYLQQMAGQLAV